MSLLREAAGPPAQIGHLRHKGRERPAGASAASYRSNGNGKRPAGMRLRRSTRPTFRRLQRLKTLRRAQDRPALRGRPGGFGSRATEATGTANGRRAWECPPNRTATAGGHGNARPTERQRPAGMGMPAQQNGNGRRAWECPPYRTATAGGDRCPRPTERQRPAGIGVPALQNGNGLGRGPQLPGCYGEGVGSTPPSCCSSGWCRNVQARLTRKFQNMTTATATRKACIS